MLTLGKIKKDEWFDYIKNVVLCTAFSYARHSKSRAEVTDYGMKDCLTLPGLGWKHFNTLRKKDDDTFFTYKDRFMRWFVQQSTKRGRVYAFNQQYYSKSCNEIIIVHQKN